MATRPEIWPFTTVSYGEETNNFPWSGQRFQCLDVIITNIVASIIALHVACGGHPVEIRLTFWCQLELSNSSQVPCNYKMPPQNISRTARTWWYGGREEWCRARRHSNSEIFLMYGSYLAASGGGGFEHFETKRHKIADWWVSSIQM